jgi:hypothetical protein
MTNQPWKLIVLLAAIFVAGGTTGGLVMLRFGHRMMPGGPVPEQWAPLHLRRLTERLQLQPGQVEQIQPIVRRNLGELARLRGSYQADSRAVYERMEREIAEKLTPEQRVKFEEFNRKMRERMKQFGNRRPGRPEGHPGGEGERPPRPDDPPKEEGK